MRVTIEDYNPLWASQFQDIKSELQYILRNVDYTSIEHVGSTSVPGLASKPIIDISIIVTNLNLDTIIKTLVDQGGYTYYGEWGIPDRHAFRKANQIPERNLYVCLDGCQALRNHIAVRDLCRQDKTVRDAYGKKKKELAQNDWYDVNEYCEAKSDILAWILGQAGMNHDETEVVKKLNMVH